ncbi:MAG: ABC transporter ATP-binding protein [Clostridia bacterium]|nr:ABC transporter ATP-binding protein [Clostridia bacterium]MDD4679617.1 ABC transporter ATP-binding protein [Clostridia bacterium]
MLLIKLISNRKFLSLVTICSSGLSVAVTLWWNTQLRGIIDAVSIGRSPSGAMIMMALVTMLVMGATNYVSGYITGYTCESLTHDLRMGYARYFVSLPVAEAEKLNAGEQLSKLQNEISGVSDYLNSNFFQLIGDAMRFLITFIWLMFISPTLTLASNLPALLIVFYVFWSSKIISSATERSQQAKGLMNKYTDTLLTLFPIIRLYDATRLALGGYMSAITAWEKHTIDSEYTAAKLMSLSGILSSIPLLILILVGGHMAISGAFSIGTLYIFLNLSGNVSGVLMNMPRYIASFRQFSANMKRLEGKYVCNY